jgi:hypothetical protein
MKSEIAVKLKNVIRLMLMHAMSDSLEVIKHRFNIIAQ